jgi:hypothetical protein
MARRPPKAKVLPAPTQFRDEERDAVLAVNRAFYRVASDRDYEAMDQLWAPTGVVFCLHPNQPPLLDRGAVMASWKGILGHPSSPKVRCRDEVVIGRPGFALVLCREVMPSLPLMATNTFMWLGARWHMISHQSGVVPAAPGAQETSAKPDRRRLH